MPSCPCSTGLTDFIGAELKPLNADIEGGGFFNGRNGPTDDCDGARRIFLEGVEGKSIGWVRTSLCGKSNEK